jgi:hypothetical protein
MGLYVAGHRAARRHAGKVLLEIVAVLIVLAAAVLAGKHFLSADTSLGDAPPASTTVVTPHTAGKKHFGAGLFTLELPADWKSIAPPQQAYKIYSWHNTAQNEGVRRLDVYVDGAPQMPVNRVLPIQANGARVVPLGQVSDNCITFTEGAKHASGSSLPGKWRRVNFLCDTANYVRDVVGTSSPDGIDTVKVVSPASGGHSLFFVYTDNSATPDYDIFTNLVTDFRLK